MDYRTFVLRRIGRCRRHVERSRKPNLRLAYEAALAGWIEAFREING